MVYVWFAVFLYLSSFVGYMRNAERQNSLGNFIQFALPVAGVYFLGWWALLVFFVGAIFGGHVYHATNNKRDGGRDGS